MSAAWSIAGFKKPGKKSKYCNVNDATNIIPYIIGVMYAIYGKIYHQYTPNLLANPNYGIYYPYLPTLGWFSGQMLVNIPYTWSIYLYTIKFHVVGLLVLAPWLVAFFRRDAVGSCAASCAKWHRITGRGFCHISNRVCPMIFHVYTNILCIYIYTPIFAEMYPCML